MRKANARRMEARGVWLVWVGEADGPYVEVRVGGLGLVGLVGAVVVGGVGGGGGGGAGGGGAVEGVGGDGGVVAGVAAQRPEAPQASPRLLQCPRHVSSIFNLGFLASSNSWLAKPGHKSFSQSAKASGKKREEE